jgi:HPt (histidine-containing phosphotransfer) domain-containing protein
VKKLTSLTEIEKITDGNKETLKELLVVFLKEGSSQIQKLQTYLDDGNLQELKNTAHKIKSSFLLIGMDVYKPVAERIEREAEKNVKKTKKEVVELITLYKQALEELKTKLEELS